MKKSEYLYQAYEKHCGEGGDNQGEYNDFLKCWEYINGAKREGKLDVDTTDSFDSAFWYHFNCLLRLIDRMPEIKIVLE